jgi:chemotaxis protein CheC
MASGQLERKTTEMLSERQLHALAAHLRSAAADASIALTRWLGGESEIVLERVRQVEMADAVTVLGDSEQPVTACLMRTQGWLTGYLIMVFDDASGFALADLLLGKPVGTSNSWGEIEQSAVLETANIIGCAYLNALARLSPRVDATRELLPTPPLFHRDFSSALMQFALVPQAGASDMVLLTETEFRFEGLPARWDLLFVPDELGVPALQELSAD